MRNYSYAARQYVREMEAGNNFRCDGPEGAIAIILIEDELEHLRDAVAACEAAGVTVRVLTNLRDALQSINWIREDSPIHWAGIISDIYMPEGLYQAGPIVPGGVPIALAAEALGIPFVHCTSGYHHGDQYNWICDLARARGWPAMVDVFPESESKGKDWPRAIRVLLELIAQKNGGG
jgi:hypothetical protein